MLLEKESIIQLKTTSTKENHPIEYVLDGDKQTYWQSEDGAVGEGLSVYIHIDLNEVYRIKQFSILPIQDIGKNGGIRSYEVYIGQDKDNMGAPIKTGELPSVSGIARPAQNLVLDQWVEGKYIKLHIKSGVGDRVGVAQLGIDVEVPEESDISLKAASVVVNGIVHEFEIGLGETKFEHAVPFIIDEDNVDFQLVPNTSKAKVIGTDQNGLVYTYTVVAEDGKAQAYVITLVENAQKGDQIDIKAISSTGESCGEGQVEHLLDSDETTIYQLYTKGNGGEDAAIVMELECPQPIHSIELKFRQDHKNGGVKAYEVWGSNDKEALVQYKVGTLDTPYTKDKGPQTILLNIETPISYLEFRPTDAHEVAALTQLNLYKPQPLKTSTSFSQVKYMIAGKEEVVEVDSKVSTYTIELNPFEKSIPQLSVETWNTFATVACTQLETTEGIAQVQVTSQDQSATQTYQFQFKKREASKNTRLKKLMYYGVEVEVEEGKKDYVVGVPQGLSAVDIVVIPEDAHARVIVNEEEVEVVTSEDHKRFVKIPLSQTKGMASICVIAEDKLTTEHYTVKFEGVSSEVKPQLQPCRPVNAKDIILRLGNGEVVVDSAFPRIISYKIDGEEAFEGQKDYRSQVAINGEAYYPQRVSYYVDPVDNSVKYTLVINKQKEGMSVPFVEIDAAIALMSDGHSKNPIYAKNMIPTDRKIVTYIITSIREYDEDEQVTTVEFVGQKLITLNKKTDAYGGVHSKSGHAGLAEVFGSVDELEAYEVVEEKLTYPMLYNGTYAAGVSNNIMVPSDKVTVIKDGIYETIGFANGPFTYRYTEGVFEGNTKTEALLETQIIFDSAQNDDGVVDWQDAAILFREIMPIPRGCEWTKDQIWWIAMNFTSSTSNPFLRVLDNGKLLSHYYDGFGQMVLNKGYQGEGHDDSHPDYSEVGIRQGGADGFNLLSKQGKAYNLRTAIHINATEYMLDAVNTKLENLQGEKLGELSHGWAWLDASYHVDQMKDLESGELERRIEELYEAIPELDLVYIDVYYRSDYHSQKFANLINRHWDLATEFAGPFEGNQVFTHWGTDLYYPGSGLNSKIYRFLYNGFKDAFNPEALLKGMQMPGVASWRGVTNMFEGVEVFYNQNLPTKYMQYSPILHMEEDKVSFENGSYVVREDGNINLYSKDGYLIAKMTEEVTRCKTTLFIPWNPITEEKIYYWNNEEGATQWTLPDSWKGLNEVYVYELTGTGRRYIETVQVVDQKVTLDYKSQVPYIIEDNKEDTNGLPQDTEWGEGSLVKNPGFDSLTFGDGYGEWKKQSHSGSTDHIQMIRMEEEELYDHKLQIVGTQDAFVSQEISGMKVGKTYTISAWVNTKRIVELGMMVGEEVYGTVIKDSQLNNTVVDHKYSGKTYQRVRFDVTIQEGQEDGKIFIHVPQVEEASAVLIDDVRIFEQPGKTDRNRDGAIYFEDFENVDEGWGVFEYALNGGYSKVHMARKDPEGRQIKSYAFDGEWSLKVSDNKEDEVIRTYPSHIEFQPDTTYTVVFEYTLFAETKGETLPADEDYPYTFSAKDQDGQTLEEITFKASKLGCGWYGGNANHDPSVEKVRLTFTTPDQEGCYVTISTPKGMPNGGGGYTSTALNVLMIDNFAVYSEGHKSYKIQKPTYTDL